MEQWRGEHEEYHVQHTDNVLKTCLYDGEELLIGLDTEVTQGTDQVTQVSVQRYQIF